ncbi:hypothetical protein [Microcoleus sp. CAWBG640]|uniref:hypothetical protein n=1 Tax=Microcoleus sp. CAWBG640 TaxID=2841653 RepID=UPI00312BA469
MPVFFRLFSLCSFVRSVYDTEEQKSRFAGGSGCTSNSADQQQAIELYCFASCDRTSKLSYRFWAIACIANRISSTSFQASNVYRSVR